MRTSTGALQGEQRAKVNGIEICFEEFGDPDGEPIVLVMGLAVQMTGWDPEFCGMLGERGYRVIRFDNRDIGLSSYIEGSHPSTIQMLLGTGSPAYTLVDMAADTAGLIDHLGLDSAHLVGVSMGGMIAQQTAIDHPDKTASLGLMMTTPGGRINGLPTPGALKVLLAPTPKERQESIESTVKAFSVIGSPAYPPDMERLRQRAGESFDRARNPAGVARQLHAITASPKRGVGLAGLEVPTVVIHGDADPLVRPAAGRALAKAIPGARIELIEGMGHDLPPQLWPRLTELLAENASRASLS